MPNKYNVYRIGVLIDYKITDKDTFFVNVNYSKGDPYFVAQNYPTGFGSWENGGYTTKSLNARWSTPGHVRSTMFRWWVVR